jgi:hypothetical protein
MITELTVNSIAVEVPEKAIGIKIHDFISDTRPKLLQWRFKDIRLGAESIQLPPGSWQILGRGNELDANQILSIIEKENDGSGHLNSWWYKNYETGVFTKDYMESYTTLLTSNKVNPDNVIILVKQ